MKRGDIVSGMFRRSIGGDRSLREGMVVYKKNNENIGVNFEHYHLAKYTTKKDATQKELLEHLLHFGTDEIYCKEQLTLIKSLQP